MPDALVTTAADEHVPVKISREDFPTLYLVASEVSRVGQRSYKRWILANLVLVVVAALLSVVPEWAPAQLEEPLAVAIAVVLLAAVLTKFMNYFMRGDRDWFDGRAVAESVKTNAWRYMMRVPPFREESNVNETFTERLRAILADYSGMEHILEAAPKEMHQITPRMKQLRMRDWQERRSEYVRYRLEGQITWYRTKSIEARASSKKWGVASIVAEGSGILIALSIFVVPVLSLVSLVGVVASIAAGFQAWTQVGRHAEVSRSYAMACQELVAIRDFMNAARTEDEFLRSIEFSEEAISREHTMWVAKRTV